MVVFQIIDLKAMSSRSAKNPKRLPWWRRPIEEKKLGIFGNRAGVVLVIGAVAVLAGSPWLILVLLAAAVAGLLAALAIRRFNGKEPPSLGL